MFGYSRNSGIPTLHNYADAVAHFEGTKPIKSTGRNNGIVPLGRRGSTYYSIEKWSNGSVACCYSGEPVVIFNPDDTIMIREGKYSHISAGYFIADVLSFAHAYQKNYRLTVYSGGREYQIPKGDGLLFRFEQTDYGKALKPVTKVKQVVHHIIRSEANKVRGQYAEFRKYMLGAIKVRDGLVTTEELENTFKREEIFYTEASGQRISGGFALNVPWFKHKDASDLFALIDSGKPEDANKAVLALVKQSGQYKYALKAYWTTPKQMDAVFDEFLFAKNKDTVFKEVELEDGVLRKDRWGFMFE
jgi:hypothetical protein